MSPFSFAVVKAVHLNWSAISCQMPLLLPFKGLLHKGTSIKICVLTMGQFLLELIMNFENSGSLLHRKRNISKKFWNLQIQKHLMAFYSPKLRETLGGWHVLYEILLKRLLGVIALTFKKLSTLLTQAKVCLNFHPLTALSNDQNDLTCLSPGHFLIDASLMCFPEPNLSALLAICPGGSTCKRSNNFFGSGCSHTILTVCSTEANWPPISRTFI